MGRPGRCVGPAGCGWERDALCPSSRPAARPSRERRETMGCWETPGGSIPFLTLTTPALFHSVNTFWTRPPSCSDTALFLSSASLWLFPLSFLLSLPPSTTKLFVNLHHLRNAFCILHRCNQTVPNVCYWPGRRWIHMLCYCSRDI